MSAAPNDWIRVLPGTSDRYMSFAAIGAPFVAQLPFCLRILLENAVRQSPPADHQRILEAFETWVQGGESSEDVPLLPARILMQDFTGVPAIVDLAAMRSAMQARGGDPRAINPHIPVDLVVDHSVTVDFSGTSDALSQNIAVEYARNHERYALLKWAETAFKSFRVVPPGTGICHQVNLEYLAEVVWPGADDLLFPDTVLGTDSHTTMINGLGVLGWGVGGIEAESVMLGQPLFLRLPPVIGVRLSGGLAPGVTATDMVLMITHRLRQYGVVGAFVEFFGPAIGGLSVADRATIGNMAPEYGATCGLFPVDDETLKYLTLTGRTAAQVARVKDYMTAQGLFGSAFQDHVRYTDVVEIDLGAIHPTIAGPKRPQESVFLKDAPASFSQYLLADHAKSLAEASLEVVPVQGQHYSLTHGDVVIAAITSCTNTSNPAVMVAAGLVARKAVERGLTVKPWVKTSLAPGSHVVSDYLGAMGLLDDLDALGFNIVGYGCTTCIGNSGPLAPEIGAAIEGGDLIAVSVLSGNRNFEGRINPLTAASYLASPPLVVAYALAGSMRVNLEVDALGETPFGEPVYLKDLWPTEKEIAALMQAHMSSDMYRRRYAQVFHGTSAWQQIHVPTGETYAWDETSSYIQEAPFFDLSEAAPAGDILDARPLLILGDSVTTDHISPAGAIRADTPAGLYLSALGIAPPDFNSYGARRGNHEVMVRGTFANLRLQNRMTPELRGGMTRLMPEDQVMSVYEASRVYKARGTSLVVFAGREYGTGSSRDWAAKGTRLLGIQAVIAQSFERIHRSNLVGMGVLPLVLPAGCPLESLKLTGAEVVTITGLDGALTPFMTVPCMIQYPSGHTQKIALQLHIQTQGEADQLKAGGILPLMLSKQLNTR